MRRIFVSIDLRTLSAEELSEFFAALAKTKKSLQQQGYKLTFKPRPAEKQSDSLQTR